MAAEHNYRNKDSLPLGEGRGRALRVLEVIRQGEIGGGESHLLDLVAGFDRSRVEPVVLAYTDGPMIDRFKAEGVKCHVIPTLKAFDSGVYADIESLIRDENIDIVHAHGSRAASNLLTPVRHMRVPLIYTVHGWSFHQDQSWLERKLRAASEWLICRKAKRVICVSESNRQSGVKAFGLKNCEVIENGINLRRFNPETILSSDSKMSTSSTMSKNSTSSMKSALSAMPKYPSLRAELGFKDDDFVVAFIARLTKQKSPLLFAQSIEKARELNPYIKALMVGEGDMADETDDFIKEHGLQSVIRRTPFRLDVPQLLASSDAFCLPSLWEGLSISLLEAMSMKLPVIVTPTDGTAETVSDGVSGLVVPFEDCCALGNAYTTLYHDERLRQRLGQAARAVVEERFDSQRVSNRVMEIYSDVVRG